ncbi:hypothetical protein FOA52_010196 [Chlamydomonas sp. UWO 241]|nr:hypothetical protein FOA52_010196 [Chlamydomonas sp. UWO 241]
MVVPIAVCTHTHTQAFCYYAHGAGLTDLNDASLLEDLMLPDTSATALDITTATTFYAASQADGYLSSAFDEDLFLEWGSLADRPCCATGNCPVAGIVSPVMMADVGVPGTVPLFAPCDYEWNTRRSFACQVPSVDLAASTQQFTVYAGASDFFGAQQACKQLPGTLVTYDSGPGPQSPTPLLPSRPASPSHPPLAPPPPPHSPPPMLPPPPPLIDGEGAVYISPGGSTSDGNAPVPSDGAAAPTPSPGDSRGDSGNNAWIAAAVVAPLFALLLCAALAVLLVRRRRRERAAAQHVATSDIDGTGKTAAGAGPAGKPGGCGGASSGPGGIPAADGSGDSWGNAWAAQFIERMSRGGAAPVSDVDAANAWDNSAGGVRAAVSLQSALTGDASKGGVAVSDVEAGRARTSSGSGSRSAASNRSSAARPGGSGDHEVDAGDIALAVATTAVAPSAATPAAAWRATRSPSDSLAPLSGGTLASPAVLEITTDGEEFTTYDNPEADGCMGGVLSLPAGADAGEQPFTVYTNAGFTKKASDATAALPPLPPLPPRGAAVSTISLPPFRAAGRVSYGSGSSSQAQQPPGPASGPKSRPASVGSWSSGGGSSRRGSCISDAAGGASVVAAAAGGAAAINHQLWAVQLVDSGYISPSTSSEQVQQSTSEQTQHDADSAEGGVASAEAASKRTSWLPDSTSALQASVRRGANDTDGGTSGGGSASRRGASAAAVGSGGGSTPGHSSAARTGVSQSDAEYFDAESVHGTAAGSRQPSSTGAATACTVHAAVAQASQVAEHARSVAARAAALAADTESLRSTSGGGVGSDAGRTTAESVGSVPQPAAERSRSSSGGSGGGRRDRRRMTTESAASEASVDLHTSIVRMSEAASATIAALGGYTIEEDGE